MVRSFKKWEEKELLSDIESAPWQVIDSFDDVNDKLNYWVVLLLSIVDKHAQHAQQDWHKYKAFRNEVNQRLRVAKSEHFRSVCKNISH